jgi:hypothetical protein
LPALVLGVDFAGPSKAADQRKKIIAVAAEVVDDGHYRVRTKDFNEPVAQHLSTGKSPGWTAQDLVNAVANVPCEVMACDFPFSIPKQLLISPQFAAAVGLPKAFGTRDAFAAFVASKIPLAANFDLAPFEGWKTEANWKKRNTDQVAVARPPLQHHHQTLFNMTMVGATVLQSLRQKYRVEPWAQDGEGSIIEVYPGGALRKLGLPKYKDSPGWAVALARDFLERNGITLELDDAICTFALTYNTGRDDPDYDGADALVALIMAIGYRERLLARAFDGADADYELEGAIWLPP